MTRFKRDRDAIAAGEYVQGALPAQMPLTLYSGLALRLRVLPDGSSCAIGLAFPGDLLGAETLFGPPTLQLRALTDLTFCRFEPAQMAELLEVPRLARRLLQAQAIAASEIEDHLAATISLPASGRLCRFILQTYETLVGRKLARGPSFALPLPRGELARLLGLTPTHLRRVRTRLARQGVLEFDGNRVLLGDLPRLRELAGPFAPTAGLRPLL